MRRAISRTNAEDVVSGTRLIRPGGSELDNRRNFETPREAHDAADRDVMPLVIWNRAEIHFRIPRVKRINRAVAERCGAAVPAYCSRENIAGVHCEMLVHSAALDEVQTVVT